VIVEDSKADVFLIREAIKAAHIHADLHVVNDGEQATRFFDETDVDCTAPCPALVVLDILAASRPLSEPNPFNLNRCPFSRSTGSALPCAPYIAC
jgi:hypothetical protein